MMKILKKILQVIIIIVGVFIFIGWQHRNEPVKNYEVQTQQKDYDPALLEFYRGLIQNSGNTCSEVESYVSNLHSKVLVNCVGVGESNKPSNEVTEAYSYYVSRPGGKGAFIVEVND